MPNKLQVGFLLSFVVTFLVLTFTTSAINSALRARGYDISRLILLGLEDTDSNNSMASSQADVLRSVDLPLLGKTDLLALVNSPAFALSLAVITLGALYTVFGPKGGKKVLDPTKWQQFPLVKKIVISPNTAIYRFGLPSPKDHLGLPIGQHISVSAEINGKDVARSYTPISSDDDKGYFDLLIKTYDLGNISKHVSLLKVGQTIRVKGPKGQFNYHRDLTPSIGMIAGGTGITPMMQVIRAAMKDPQDTTKVSLIYANVNPEDILLKAEIDALSQLHPNRFTVYYVLNNPPAGWQGGSGFVSKDQIEKFMPAATFEGKILICGPPPMVTAMKKHLADLNYPAPRTISKLDDKVFLF
ncbi:ferredoxin reductase-like C-terminal NADP-linked domain-containing protein [Flagelloscypha sp. PMI_526]|nr:ferredoxin reductase-like C-terminal NADP-linked domain-containing protein [Flagelloscypha sp. PMI_526]